MVNIMKMRLPLSEAYNHLARLVGESDAWMNWSGVFSWCQDKNPGRPAFRETRGCTALREARGCVTCRERTLMPGDVRSKSVGFRPSFKAETDIPDGQVCVVGTLFMNGEPVRIPACSRFAASYVPGATLELRPALEDENFQVRAIRAGGVLIADRVLLRNISWDDIQEALAGDKPAAHPLRLGKMRFPTCAEYDSLADTAKEANGIMHWKGIYSWCQDVKPGWPSTHAVRGYLSARYWLNYNATSRSAHVGFRPVFEILNSDTLPPDGTIVTVGTLYMAGEPVKVPLNPTWDGDIPDYTPDSKLELREALGDPAYQVNAIRVGDILIVDRVLLKNISWQDLREQGFCGSAHNTISKEETTMKSNATIICLNDEKYGACAIACSKEDEEKVRNFLVKWYSGWFAKCEGMVGVSPWNNIVDAIRDAKELLGDDNLQLLGGCTIIRVPTYDF